MDVQNLIRDLTIALVQSDLKWEDPPANHRHLQGLLEKIAPQTDLVVLPEMFSTGFSMRAPGLAQDMAGETVRWLQETAHRKGVDIAGSVMIEESGNYFNRLIWATPDNKIFTYDKKHLFRYAGEEKVYTPGNEHLTVTLKGWRIRPFICYDLRFPIWVRNFNKSYDLALFVANWPAARASHWQILLSARAVENQCYVAGVNRVGHDGNQLTYRGNSTVVSPDGTVLSNAGEQESVTCLVLSAQMLKTYRQTFPAWMDADADLLKSQNPGNPKFY